MKRLLFCFLGIALLLFTRDALAQKAHASDISGFYKSVPQEGEDDHCDMSVRISKIKGHYVYSFNISGKTRKGKVTVQWGKGKEDTYITFEGIEWAEYEGDISNETDDQRSSKPQMKLPVGVSGQLSDKEITIQNYGNSMNYYVVFAECGQKYISLVKQ